MDSIARIRISQVCTEDGMGELAAPYNTHIDTLKKELEHAREEVASLTSKQESKDKMLANQMEMLRVQQDTLTTTQNQLKEMKDKLSEVDSVKLSLKESNMKLEAKEKAEEAAKKALALSEKRNEEQQITIKNLQEALLSTKQQLEELQAKTAVDETLRQENAELQCKIGELQNKIADIQSSLDRTESRYQKVEEECTKYQYNIELVMKLKKVSDDKYAAAMEEANSLQSEISRLQMLLDKKSLEIRNLHLSLHEEKSALVQVHNINRIAAERLRDYMAENSSLQQIKSFLEDKGSSLISQNCFLHQEIQILQQELSNSKNYCDEVCNEYLSLVDFVEQWMIDKHKMHKALTVNLQQKTCAVKNLSSENKFLLKTISRLCCAVRQMQHKKCQITDNPRTQGCPCPVIRALRKNCAASYWSKNKCMQ